MYIKARDIMHDPNFMHEGDSVREVSKFLDEKNIGSVLIECGDGSIGILTERDIIKKVTAKGLDANEVRAGDVMTRNVTSIEPDADIYSIASIFSQQNIRRLPVIEEGRVLGILTTRDVTKGLI